MESWKGPELGAATAGARRRGGVRPYAGHALPPRRAVRPLASGQAATRLPLRSARGHARLRARARLRRARRARPRIVVGIGRRLGGTLALGDVAEIDPDARPRARASAHRVDEDVIDLQQ